MDNKELLAKIEAWVDENEEEFDTDAENTVVETVAVDSYALIKFIRTLLA